MAKVTQRSLTRAMKAAKGAGIRSFELVDIESGLIFRTAPDGGFPPSNDLDDELNRFEARLNG